MADTFPFVRCALLLQAQRESSGEHAVRLMAHLVWKRPWCAKGHQPINQQPATINHQLLRRHAGWSPNDRAPLCPPLERETRPAWGPTQHPPSVLDLHAPLSDSDLSDPTKARSAAKTNGNV
jgi:hypothetical protein